VASPVTAVTRGDRGGGVARVVGLEVAGDGLGKRVRGDVAGVLILHDAFDGYTRFDQFQDSLGISSSMLTARLKTLVADGLLERRPYQTNPVRHEYVLTGPGRSLRPVIVALAAWGNSRLAPEECAA
jgi:DNA-binding HxlR family transcriptional regulator